jgi:hypothetical protein
MEWDQYLSTIDLAASISLALAKAASNCEVSKISTFPSTLLKAAALRALMA